MQPSPEDIRREEEGIIHILTDDLDDLRQRMGEIEEFQALAAKRQQEAQAAASVALHLSEAMSLLLKRKYDLERDGEEGVQWRLDRTRMCLVRVPPPSSSVPPTETSEASELPVSESMPTP